MAYVSPDVLEQQSRAGIPSSVLDQFKFGLDACRSARPEPCRKFRPSAKRA